MRDGQRLPKLSTPHRLLHQLCEEGVRVIVKAFDFRACQNQKRVGRASEIEFRSSAIVDAMKVADRKRGLGTFALIQNALRAEENIGHALGSSAFCREVRDRLLSSLQGHLSLTVASSVFDQDRAVTLALVVFRQFRPTPFSRNFERCLSELILDIPFCSTIKQEFHNFCVSLFDGLMQRRTTHVADGVHIGAAFD